MAIETVDIRGVWTFLLEGGMKLNSLLRRFSLISSLLNLVFSLIVAAACVYPFYSFFIQERWKDVESGIHSESGTFFDYFMRLNDVSSLVSSRTRLKEISELHRDEKIADEAFSLEARKILDDTIMSSSSIKGITRVFPDGIFHVSVGIVIPLESLKENLGKTRVCLKNISGKPHLILISPVFSENGTHLATDIITLNPESLGKLAGNFISKSELFNSLSIFGEKDKVISELCSVNKYRESRNVKMIFFSDNFKDDVTDFSNGTIKVINKFNCYYFLSSVFSDSDCNIYLMTAVPEDFFSVFSDEKIYLIMLLVLTLALVSYVIMSELLKPLESKVSGHIFEISDLNKKLSKEILDHHQTESLLKKGENKFRVFMDNIPGIVFVKDSAGRYAYLNNFMTKNNLDDHERWIGRTDADLWPEKKTHDHERYDQKVLEQSQNFNTIDLMNFRTGSKRFITYRFPILSEGEESFIGGISFDISDVLRMEDELAKEKERLSMTLLAISDGVIVTDRDWRIKIINKSARDMVGWGLDESIGKEAKDILKLYSITDGLPIELGELLKNTKSEDRMEKRSYEIQTKSGTRKIIEDGLSEIRDNEGNCVGFVIVFRDITLMAKMQENLKTVQKMESIGLLAGGIAHDFNNILLGVIGNISLARMMTKKYPEIDEVLLDAESSANRAKELTNRLITFAKGGVPEVSLCSPKKLVCDTLKINLAGSNVKFTKMVPPDIWGITVDYSLMAQAFSNIIVNAKQAMPDGGELFVDVKNIILPEKNERKLSAGPYVEINFRNTGETLPKNIRDKIFDPFFTTRSGSSGLGLSITFSIVVQHRGYITVEDGKPSGTVFSVVLPATGQPVPEQLEEEEFVPVAANKVNLRKILIMDDEESIRKLTKRILERVGHKVSTASNGEDAIRIYKKALAANEKFDLVILDLTIVGGMGGKETLGHLMEICPDVISVVSSGYSEDAMMVTPEKYGFKYRLPKPYSLQELVRFVDSIP